MSANEDIENVQIQPAQPFDEKIIYQILSI